MNNEYCMKLKGLNDIPDTEYEGYIWMSDSKSPEKINGKYDFTKISTNPFIIEGNLISKDNSFSISIRHVGNSIYIHQFDLNKIDNLPPDQKTVRKYLPHRIDEVKLLKFTIVWLPEQDSMACNFETLKPIFQIFNGFES